MTIRELFDTVALAVIALIGVMCLVGVITGGLLLTIALVANIVGILM